MFNCKFLQLQYLGCDSPGGIKLHFRSDCKEPVKREFFSHLMQPLVTPQSMTLILAKGSTGGAVGKG